MLRFVVKPRIFATVCRRTYASADSGESLVGAKATLSGERSLNKVQLIGRIGRDPEVRGSVERPVTTFSLATSINFRKSDGEYTQRTEWHRISVFRPVLNDWCANTLRKGDKVFVGGSIQYSVYADKITDEMKNATSIIADEVLKLASKRGTDMPIEDAETM